MAWHLNGVRISDGQSFTIGETQYPHEVLDLWHREELKSLGLEWVDPPQIAPTVDELCAAVDAERDRRTSRDFAYDFGVTPALDDNGAEIEAGVRHLQMRPEDRANWQALQGAALTAVVSGQPDVILPMRAEDNWNIQTTAPQVLQVMATMITHGSALLFHGGALKSAIRSAEDPASINIMDGWP